MANDPKKDYIHALFKATQNTLSPVTTLAGHALNDAGNFIKNDLAKSSQSLNPAVAIPSRIIANPGQFADNALQGAGDFVKGTLAIPGNVVRSVQQGTEGKDLVNLKNGIVNQYATIAKDPYGTFIKDPVGTSMAIAPIGGAIDKLAGGGEVAANAAKAAPKGWQSEGMKAQGLPPIGEKPMGSMGFVGKSAAKQGAEEVSKVSNVAADTYLKGFTVRRELGKNMNMQGVAKQMINDGITGDIPTITKKVQTVLDKTEQMKRNALSSVSGGIDITPAQKVINEGLNNVPELAGKVEKADVYRHQLQAYLPKATDIGGAASPLDIYDSMKNIRNLGYDLVEQGKDVYGRTLNAEKVNVGKVFIDTAKELNDSLDGTLKNQPLFVSMANDPAIVGDLHGVSPAVANRVRGVQGWKDMQAVQKPYVDMASIARETNNAAMTPGAKFTGQIVDAISKGVGTGAGGMAGGIPGAALGFAGGQLAGPFINMAVEKMLPSLMTNAGKVINNIGGEMPSLPKLGGAVVDKLAPAGVIAMNTKDNVQQATTNGKPVTSAGAGGAITPFYQDVKPDAQGHYQLPAQSTGSNTFMTEQQREQAEAGLTPGTPAYQKIEQQFKTSQEMAKAQYTPQVAGFMKQAPAILANSNKLYDDMTTFPMGIINNFDSLNKAAKYVDPKYQSFVTALDGLNNGFNNLYAATMGQKPTENMLISPKDSSQQAQVKIAYMNNFFAGTYGNYKDAYAATTSPAGTLSNTGAPVPAAPIATPPPSDFSQMVQTQSLPQISLPPLGGQGL